MASCRPNDRHTSLALYILLRGVTLLIRCGNKPDAPPAVRKVLIPTRWQHGDTTLMCLATSQILYSWIMMPHTLPSSYIKFLNRHGGRQQWHYNAARVCSIPCAMCYLRCGAYLGSASQLIPQQNRSCALQQFASACSLDVHSCAKQNCAQAALHLVSRLCSSVFEVKFECGEQELCERAGKPMAPTPYKSLQHTKFRTFQGTCPCHVLHPGQTCNGFMLSFFPGAYLRSVPFPPNLSQSCD